MVRHKRMLERIDNKMDTSHRERVQQFNANLSKLPEHFDIPKVGPG